MEQVHRVLEMTLLGFGVGNSSSSNADKNNFIVLGKGPTDNINGSFGAAEKKFSTDFINAKTKFCLSFHYNGDSSYLIINGEKSVILNPIIKM